uniref:CHCH domain-containing protein n=1 Tax=Tetraselmis sp. GSL018 TaxID=582737 RepID=A0A061SAH0_9CHLO
MPRRSSARTAPAPRPAASSPSAPPSAPRNYGTASSQPDRGHSSYAAPPPAYSAPAPPPANGGSSGGSMLGNMVGMVGQGMALGTGSAIAHRAVDSLWGSGGSSSAPSQATEQQVAQAMPSTDGPCGDQAKAFSDCMSQNYGEMAACQQYFDAMQACKRAFA